MPVREMTDELELHYSGTIEPSYSVALMFKNTGTIEQVFVDEGDLVKKGQALASLDKSMAQNMFDASQASYEQAKDAYDRLKSVHEKGSLADIKWVEMESKLKQAESQLQIARANLNDCILRAPDDGMIGHRNAQPGQSSVGVVAPFELVKIDRVHVKISVPENEISKMKKGMKAGFSISALDDASFEGRVDNVGIMADRISRTYEVKILANNPGNSIKPGMVCDVKLSVDGKKDIVVVPAKAVTMDGKGSVYVWKVDPATKTVKKEGVKLGQYTASGIIVFTGLQINDLVVTDGKEKLSENSSILY